MDFFIIQKRKRKNMNYEKFFKKQEEDLVKSIVNKKIPSIEEKIFFDSLGFQEFINELKI